MPLNDILNSGPIPRYSAFQGSPDNGRRLDFSPKGKGYFGPMTRPDGGVSTELSFDFEQNGKNVFAPLMVPTLSKQELNHLLSGQKPTEDIYAKAIQFALERLRSGKSAFANPLEISPLPK